MQKIHLHKLNFTAVAQSHLHLFHLCKWSKDITKFVFDIDSFLFLKQQMKLDGSNGFISFIINYAVSICGFFVGSPSVKSWSTKYRFKFIAFSCRFNYFFQEIVNEKQQLMMKSLYLIQKFKPKYGKKLIQHKHLLWFELYTIFVAPSGFSIVCHNFSSLCSSFIRQHINEQCERAPRKRLNTARTNTYVYHV